MKLQIFLASLFCMSQRPKFSSIVLVLFLVPTVVVWGQEDYPATNSAELRAILTDINHELHPPKADYKMTIVALNNDIDKLTMVLDAGKLGKTETMVAFFYRARTRGEISQLRWRHGEKVDTDAVQRVVEDIDKVIASNIDAPEWGLKTSEAQYIAGALLVLPLNSSSRAYTYFEKCAEQGHAGCLNLMANARFTGESGVKIDIQQALEYHSRVFATGIDYRCAGPESARTIAAIIYFTGVRRPGDDELEWLQKSYELSDKLQASNAPSTCARFEAEVEEFLYRLSRGERKDSILQEAANLGQGSGMGPAIRKAVLDYLAGAETNDAFAATIAASKNDFEFCRASLYGLWYSELTKNRPQGKRYHLALARSDHGCRTELIYAKKFSVTSSAEPHPTAPHSR
jgi:hypothetical protein